MKTFFYIFQDHLRCLMGSKQRYFVFRGLTIGCFLMIGAGCSKDAVAPGKEAALKNEYTMERMDYFLDDNDRIDTLTVSLPGMEFANWGNALLEQQYTENFDELVKTSLFTWDTVGKGLPRDLDLAQFAVHVPSDYSSQNQFSLFSQSFLFSDSVQQKRSTGWTNVEQKVGVAPYSKVIISRTINRYDMRASFRALISNKTTRERYTVSGKWEGILRYNKHSIVFSETALQ